MARHLVILGTSVTLPDPVSVTELAARFQEQGEQLADLEVTVQGLARPDAWGDWTGLAADAFGQSIGQLPAELGDVRDAYGDVAWALRQYAGQLEPVVNSLSSLSFQAEEAEYTLAAVERARSQAFAHGPVAVAAWDVKLADALAVVGELRLRLSRLVAELNALASACTRQVKAAEPRSAHKSLFGELESDFVRDVADPLARAVKETAKLELDVAKLELDPAIAVVLALLVHPVTDLVHDATGQFDAAKWATVLGEVSGVLGILALIPGIDVVAAPAALIVGGAAAGLEWWAAYHHEDGASYLQAGLYTLTFALSGVTLLAKAGVAAAGLADGADASDSGQALWEAGAKRAFSVPVMKTTFIDELHPDDGSIGQELFDNVREPFTFPSGAPSDSPAVVTVTRVGWTADRLDNLVTTGQDIAAHKSEIGDVKADIDAVKTDIGALTTGSQVP